MQNFVTANCADMQNEYTDRYFNRIKELILRPAFRKIALTYCASTTDFYDTVHEMEFSLRDMIEDAVRKNGNIHAGGTTTGIYERTEQINRSNHRLNSLVDRLKSADDLGYGKPTLFFYSPKVFDKKLSEAMIFSFQAVSGILDDDAFCRNIPAHHLRAMDGRNGFAFPEYAALCCLYISINGPAMQTLNRPIKNGCPPKRAKARMNNIRATLCSEQYFRAIGKTVFDLMAVAREKDYCSLLNSHCLEFWMAPQKRELKTTGYALNRYMLDRVDDSVFERADGAETTMRFLQQYCDIEVIQHTFYVLCPIAEALLVQAIPNDLSPRSDGTISLYQYLLESKKIDSITKDYIKRNGESSYCVTMHDYVWAGKLAAIVSTYVKAILDAVVMLLKCLPEVDCLWETL